MAGAGSKKPSKTVRKNLLDLEHQQLVNFVNIAIITEMTFLIALWVGEFVADAGTKIGLTFFSSLITLLILLELYRRLGCVRREIAQL